MSDGSLRDRLRALITAGVHAEDATEQVLREMPKKPLAEYARPFVLSDAQNMERRVVRRAEDRAFRDGSGSGEARLKLPQVEFKTWDVTKRTWSRVTWAKATREQHEARIVWLRTCIDDIEVDLGRHERAAKLLAERGADCLEEIPGWQDLIGDPEDASGEAA